MTKHDDKNENQFFKDANHEGPALPAPFTRELIHEFTNMVTAVIGYSELERDRKFPSSTGMAGKHSQANQCTWSIAP